MSLPYVQISPSLWSTKTMVSRNIDSFCPLDLQCFTNPVDLSFSVSDLTVNLVFTGPAIRFILRSPALDRSDELPRILSWKGILLFSLRSTIPCFSLVPLDFICQCIVCQNRSSRASQHDHCISQLCTRTFRSIRLPCHFSLHLMATPPQTRIHLSTSRVTMLH